MGLEEFYLSVLWVSSYKNMDGIFTAGSLFLGTLIKKVTKDNLH